MRRQSSFKIDRIQTEIKRELQSMLISDVKDPRIQSFVSISEVEVSKDLSYCKVYVEIMDKEKDTIMKGLKNASGFMRSELAKRINLRKTPELDFRIDDTMDKQNRIEELLKEGGYREEIPQGEQAQKDLLRSCGKMVREHRKQVRL
mgnify:CR=1 FL=1